MEKPSLEPVIRFYGLLFYATLFPNHTKMPISLAGPNLGSDRVGVLELFLRRVQAAMTCPSARGICPSLSSSEFLIPLFSPLCLFHSL